jgi:hypothetical protein
VTGIDSLVTAAMAGTVSQSLPAEKPARDEAEMAQNMLSALRSLDPHVLTEVVRRDQQEPDLDITDWTVRLLSNKGVINPDGLFLFSGEARADGTTRPWSVVLKHLKKPEGEQQPHELWYWKREVSAAHSGLLDELPGPVVAPRCYGTTEFEDSAWLWMEHIHDARGGPWTLDDFAFAAKQLGRFNGAYLTGTLLPSASWFCQDLPRQWVEPSNPEQADWENPYISRYVSPDLRAQAAQLWAERERFYRALDRLPRVFSHFDYQRRNLFVRHNAIGHEEVVATDWAWCGTGPVGGDLNALVGSSCLLFEWEPARMRELEEAVVEPYVAGLRDAGWDGDPDLVRLGYTAWLALHCGVAAPALMDYWCIEKYEEAVGTLLERSLDEAASGWATMCAFALSRADEARELMPKLQPELARGSAPFGTLP